MFPIWEITRAIILMLPRIIVYPFFWIVLVLVFTQYKRMGDLETKIYGRTKNSPFKRTLTSLFYGLIGGILASYIIIIVGIYVDWTKIFLLWVVALGLIFIDLHFVCFSYAAGILGISSLVFGYPDIQIPWMVALVAVLHMVEGILIYFSGYEDATPVIMKKDDGRAIGGFNMQKFWPIPIMVLVLFPIPELPVEGIIEMPSWWPLISPPEVSVPDGHHLMSVMMPIVAALGYGDLALTRLPYQKARRSAVSLGIYSIILLALAILADNYSSFLIIAALFSPIGHEFIIRIERKVELENKPRFQAPDKGVMILDVLPDSPAQSIGFSPGEVIKRVNGVEIEDAEHLIDQMSRYDFFVEFETEFTDEYKLSTNHTRTFRGEPRCLLSLGKFGLMAVPKYALDDYVMIKKKGLLKTFLQRIFRKR